MADESNRKNYEDIKRDLIRTAIKQPLLTMIRESKDQDRKIPIIIEANDDYYLGKIEAVKEVQDLVRTITNAQLVSIGGDQNPFYKTSLTARQILDIVDADDTNAFRWLAEAAEKARAASPLQAGTKRPGQVGSYLAIRRIWYNHPINPLIDKSVSTVK